MKKKILRMLLTAALIVFVQVCVKAQGDPGDDPDRVPLDPGTWVLVAAGAGYGVKKWRDARLENKKNSVNTTADFSKK